jgi:hypothetical protein
MAQITIIADGNYTITPIFRKVITTFSPVTPPPVTPPPVAPPPVAPPVAPPIAPPPPTPTPSISKTPQITPTTTPSITPQPTTTPQLTRTPQASPQPEASVTPTRSLTPAASNTPAPSKTPQPTPSSTPLYWRSCIDGNVREGTAPDGYVEVVFAKGGTCWEPSTVVGFEPALNEVLRYQWRRGSVVYPEARTFKVTNPSYAINYEVKIITNPDITVTPDVFLLSPRANKDVTVKVTTTLLEKLGDGVSNIEFSVEIREL